MKKLVALVGMILSVGANSAENLPSLGGAQKGKFNAESSKKTPTLDEQVEEIDLDALEREINPISSIISQKYQPKSNIAK
ncbi:hypothetical protein [Oligoflexus tunisiensis]|uniref:hypothetical protein n=1 Tax=Oligoflexus tunisiensis TaxID=708132 RepID=UPI00114D1B0C|nr:hypothetical protein [Oligoflexus tunisiensis]